MCRYNRVSEVLSAISKTTAKLYVWFYNGRDCEDFILYLTSTHPRNDHF